jgi:hypothetical protein
MVKTRTFDSRSPAVLDHAALALSAGAAVARPLPPVLPHQLQKKWEYEPPEGWKQASKPDKNGETYNKPSSFSERLETWTTQRRYDKAQKAYETELAAWEKNPDRAL